MDTKRPLGSVGTLSQSEIEHSPEVRKHRLDQSNPDNNYGLGVCRVTEIDYEQHYVTLRVLIGSAQEFERVPVPLTYPSAGARHFLGAMPQVGDHCVVGWMPQEASQKTMTPVILSWIIPGTWLGRDHLVGAAFDPTEHDAATSRNKEELRGVFDRTRHKLRHLRPGEVVGSSAQGSDIALNESVMLSNRRGNEFILRDEDQAAITRSVQNFTVASGARVLTGPVQRDALSLPTTMFSDGKLWDGITQAVAGVPVAENSLPASAIGEGSLTPSKPFQRALDDNGDLGAPLVPVQPHLDPYTFLQAGGFIDEDGVRVEPSRVNDAIVAGKSIYRVGLQTTKNPAADPSVEMLTEHRVEVFHTSDGTLPVTSQTDSFEADMLPDDVDTPTDKTPFIVWCTGSVVGNDPYTKRGRAAYGLPLLAEIFDSTGGVSPRIYPARVGATREVSDPVSSHLASLFKIRPIGKDLPETFWGVNKQGQFRGYLSGPSRGSSLDLAVAGGARFAFGGGLELLLNGPIHLATRSKEPLGLRNEQGPVHIYAGGSSTGAQSASTNSQDLAERPPSLLMESKDSGLLKVEKSLTLKSQKTEMVSQVVNLQGQDSLRMASSKELSLSAQEMRITSTGKRVEAFSGPKNLLPTSGALHEKTYAPLYPGINAEESLYVFGNRDETFLLGNHTTSVLVGNLTYQTALGTFEARSLLNSVNVTPALVSATALAGNVSMQALAGAATIQASAGVVISALAGPTVVRSSSALLLGAPITGPDVGPIITAGSLEPFSGLPFITFGMGAKNHLITP